MKFMLRRAAVFAALVSTLAVCGVDNTSAPTPVAPPQASLLGDLGGVVGGTVDNLLSPLSCNTKGYGSVTKTIGTGGGTIIVGPHRLVVPPGALSKNVSITASAPAGNSIRMNFQPEGLQFAKSSALTMSFRDCGILVLDPKVVYVDDKANLLEVLLTVPNLLGKTATGKLDHFSGYMLWE